MKYLDKYYSTKRKTGKRDMTRVKEKNGITIY